MHAIHNTTVCPGAGLRHLESPLLAIGARTIADLGYLTPADLESVGISGADILNLSVTVAQ